MKSNLKVTTLAIAAIFLMSSATQAQTRRQESLTIFYVDEQHSSVAGYTIRYCDGGRLHSGAYTMFDDENYYGCD